MELRETGLVHSKFREIGEAETSVLTDKVYEKLQAFIDESLTTSEEVEVFVSVRMTWNVATEPEEFTHSSRRVL